MTGEHRHTNDTTYGQRVSPHSLPTLLCFNFFPTAQNILKCEAFTNTIENKSDVSNCHRTNEVHEHQKTIKSPFVNGTFGFAPPTSRPFCKCEAFANTAEKQTIREQNQKSHFLLPITIGTPTRMITLQIDKNRDK